MSAKRFRLMTDAMPHMVLLIQGNGASSYFNQRWTDYTGLSIQQSLDQGWLGTIYPGDSQRVSALWDNALAAGAPFECECRLRRADGGYRWMLGRAVLQHGKAGESLQWLATFTDIDDLKRASELAEKSLSIIRIAGRVSRLGGWTIDLPERILTWSDENCIIHDVLPGYTPTLDEGINYFLPEDRATVIRLVDACAKNGTPYEFILPKLTAKGRRIWVRSIGEAVRDDAGNIIRLQGAFQDISEQKAAEARMLTLQAQLSITLESITDGFYLLDKDWKFTYLNAPAEQMLRRERHELLGKNLWEVFPQAVGTYVHAQYHLTAQERRTARFETFYEPLNTWFDVHVYPMEAGLAVYFQDITTRRAEHAQLQLLETAVSRLNDIVVIMEANAIDDSGPRIVFVNDAFERVTGYSRSQAVGHPAGLFWSPKNHETQRELIRVAMKNWHAVRAEIAITTQAGHELWLEIDVAPIADDTGRFTHWVAVKRDITERRLQRQEILDLNVELEARVMRRTMQLEKANKELESFAYSVSHDLRSPLNTVDGFSRLLLKFESGNLSDKGKHYLNRMGFGVKHMGELIEGLLSLAHLSRGNIKSEMVDLSEIARRIESDFPEHASLHRPQVIVHEGMTAPGDPRLLSSLYQNLMDNAWKFTAKNVVAQIVAGTLDADGETVFFVSDNGVGFDMAYAHKLFGIFERLHSPGEFAGTGIGLANVKRVVERHGGRVWAESQPDIGTTIFFTLRLAVGATA